MVCNCFSSPNKDGNVIYDSGLVKHFWPLVENFTGDVNNKYLWKFDEAITWWLDIIQFEYKQKYCYSNF